MKMRWNGNKSFHRNAAVHTWCDTEYGRYTVVSDNLNNYELFFAKLKLSDFDLWEKSELIYTDNSLMDCFVYAEEHHVLQKMMEF